MKQKLKNIFINENYHYNGLQLLGMALTLIGFVPTILILCVVYKPNWVQTPLVLVINGITYIIIGLIMYWIGKRTKK